MIRKECPDCQGTGRAFNYYMLLDPKSWIPFRWPKLGEITIPCPCCKGKGWIWEEWRGGQRK